MSDQNDLQQKLMNYIIREADPVLRKKLLKHKLKVKTSLLKETRMCKDNQCFEYDGENRKVFKFQDSLVPKDLAPSVTMMVQSRLANPKSLNLFLAELDTSFEELSKLLGIPSNVSEQINSETHALSASLASRPKEIVSDILQPE